MGDGAKIGEAAAAADADADAAAPEEAPRRWGGWVPFVTALAVAAASAAVAVAAAQQR